MFDAQSLDERLRNNLDPIFKFLRAARRSTDEEFIFPYPEQRILVSLNAVRAILHSIEDMVVGNSDLDATAPDSDDGDPDATKVAIKVEA